MSAMAEAVETSEFVLLCMSDSYKRSTYCQAEAEYAFSCKRRLLPLIVVEGYKPDGWLGFMIGSRIYVDYGRFDFDTACGKLMNEISLQRKRPLPSAGQPARVNQHEIPTAPAPAATETKTESASSVPSGVPDWCLKRTPSWNFARQFVDRWVPTDVLDFLFVNQLQPLMPLCQTMHGRALIELFRMCLAHSHQTYMLLNEELQSTNQMRVTIGVYTRFLSIMKRMMLTAPPPPPPVLQRPPPAPLPRPPARPVVRPSRLPYDILITSNASTPQVLNIAQRIVDQRQFARKRP